MKAQGLNHNEYLSFQIKRNIIGISKDFLIILENLRDENVISLEYYNRLRSQILGKSNDKIRDLEDTINSFNIELRKT